MRRAKKPVRQMHQARSRLINRSARNRLTRPNMSWYVLITVPGEDLKAQRILRDLGYFSVLPLDFAYRRRSKYSPDKMRVVNPAMPGYLFVGFEDGQEDWLKVLDQRVISGVIEREGLPASVNGAVILEFLRSGADRWAVQSAHRFMLSHKEFAEGDRVEIIKGAFAGRYADVGLIRGRYAKIQIEAFGSTLDVDRFPLDGLVLQE